MDRSRVAIVIPAFNEEKTIVSVVKQSLGFGVVIVVDDGSADRTGELAGVSGAIVVFHPQNFGYEEAINTGFKRAHQLGCRIFITLDADGQHDPILIDEFIEKIESGADLVIGVRSSFQRLGEQIYAWYTNFQYGIKDPLCGLKAYSSELYEMLGYFDKRHMVGTELMIYAAKKGCNVAQIGFHVKKRNGKSRFGASICGNIKIFKALYKALQLK